MNIRESLWQRTVIDAAHLTGWRVAHFRPARTAQGWRTPVAADGCGFPDLVLARPGEALAVELKSDTGRLTRYQEVWLELLAGAGLGGHVWRPRDWVEVEGVLRRGR